MIYICNDREMILKGRNKNQPSRLTLGGSTLLRFECNKKGRWRGGEVARARRGGDHSKIPSFDVQLITFHLGLCTTVSFAIFASGEAGYSRMEGTLQRLPINPGENNVKSHFLCATTLRWILKNQILRPYVLSHGGST